MNNPNDKKKKVTSQPTTPMFASIMGPVAAKLNGKICKVVNMEAHTYEWIECVKETKFNGGPGDDNLEKAELEVGMVGMVLEPAPNKTHLRFWVNLDDPLKDGVYHVNILNLEVIDDEEGHTSTPYLSQRT